MIVCGDFNAQTATNNLCMASDPIGNFHDLNSPDDDNDEYTGEKKTLYFPKTTMNNFGSYLINFCNEFVDLFSIV